MFKLKKSQISIFVIIGIILIIVVAFLLFNNKFEFWQSHDTKVKNQISQIVDDCLEDSANRGAFLLGYQGGYIEIPQSIEANPFAYIDFGMKIPNWDTQRQDIPTIQSMQNELNNFVKTESESCIQNNIKALKETFDIQTKDNLTVDTTINDENIIVDAKYTIILNEKNSGEVFTVSDYTIKLDRLRLGDLYNLALEIYKTEKNTYLFEDLTLDQIQTASDYSDSNSMPSEGMSFSCSPRIWTIPQLKENLAKLNNNNYKYLQFVGTYPKDDIYNANLNDELGTTSYKQYYKNFYTYSLPNPKPSFKNYNVEVFMPSKEITNRSGIFRSYPFREPDGFVVTPSSGQIVKPMKMELDVGAKIPIPCVQIYHELYTLDYDLIIKLSDYNEDGQGFTFQFPLRVQIYDNQAKTKPLSYIQEEPKTLTTDTYCNNETFKYPMTVIAHDVNDDETFLDGVNISYKCMNLKCDIGQTSKPYFMGIERRYATSQLQTNFPFCIGGQVIGKKTGYHIAKEKGVNTDESLLNRNLPYTVDLEMIPKKTFDLETQMFWIAFKEGGGKWILSKDDGYVYVTIENKELEFENTAIWPVEEPGYLDKIELLDKEGTTYNLTVFYTDKNYEIKGLLEVKNWQPDIHSGNKMQFTIPASNSVITEDNYLEFYNYVQEKALEPEYRVKFY